eukprot:TRINITY_DN9431_c0_g1_i2.p1 TRINITY_DN9431_c0_g1~~TRINITY_DN9431_c0_g1_i2.p1  ORF type:complete len:185 (+),score=29.44 TRINITY_DN9431_c0_g1_i2:38-592(+)
MQQIEFDEDITKADRALLDYVSKRFKDLRFKPIEDGGFLDPLLIIHWDDLGFNTQRCAHVLGAGVSARNATMFATSTSNNLAGAMPAHAGLSQQLCETILTTTDAGVGVGILTTMPMLTMIKFKTVNELDSQLGRLTRLCPVLAPDATGTYSNHTGHVFRGYALANGKPMGADLHLTPMPYVFQ